MDFSAAALKKLSDEELAEALKHVVGNKDLPRVRAGSRPPFLSRAAPKKLNIHCPHPLLCIGFFPPPHAAPDSETTSAESEDAYALEAPHYSAVHQVLRVQPHGHKLLQEAA